MSFQDFAQGTSSRPVVRGNVPELLRNAERLLQQIDAQTVAIRSAVDASKDKFDADKMRGQVQETFKLGNQAAIFLKQARDIEPANAEATGLRSRLTTSLAALRNVHNVVLSREKRLNAEAKMAVNKAKQEVQADPYDPSDDEGTENEALMETRRRQVKHLKIQSEIATNEAIIAERETGIQEIEIALTEIGKIMKEMSQDVQRQGEQLEYIEDHIEQTLAHTKAGTQEVKKAMKHQKSTRKRMCCLLFFVLGVIAAIVVYFSVFY
eukprot:EG_transcript_17366